MPTEVAPERSGVDVEFPCQTDDRKRAGPVRRNPAASLFMNRVLKELAPRLDERVAGTLKDQLGPRNPVAIMDPAVATPLAHGLVDPQTPQPRLELYVDFQQAPAKHELLRQALGARQRLHELLETARQH